MGRAVWVVYFKATKDVFWQLKGCVALVKLESVDEPLPVHFSPLRKVLFVPFLTDV